MRCPGCGAQSTGRFCSQCGTPLTTSPGSCPHCGAGLTKGAAFCGNCGKPVAERASKPKSAHLPWVLSALALFAFSVAIAMFVQRQSAPRFGDDPMTGGIDLGTSAGATSGAPATGGSAMLSAAELAAMPPREAADRLFDRAMREQEGGGEQAAFFATMSLNAYGGLPPDQLDSDARFHMGLLHVISGNVQAAQEVASALLESNPRQLYGLLIQLRVAEAGGDADAVAEARNRMQEAVAAGETTDLPEYEPHRTFLDQVIAGDGVGG
jgi:hypothetical protein